MLEKDIENKVRKWAKKNDFEVIKFTPRGDRGWPDRIFIAYDGTHIWIEFKRPGQEPEPIQYYRLGLLQNRGCNAVWFDNAPDAINYLSGFTRPCRQVQ